MTRNYTDEPDSPLPLRDSHTHTNEQVHWEDLESYIGTSDDESNHRRHPYPSSSTLWSRPSALQREYEPMETSSSMHDHDHEDVQWWHSMFGGPGVGEWDGVQVLAFAVFMSVVCVVSTLIIWVLVT